MKYKNICSWVDRKKAYKQKKYSKLTINLLIKHKKQFLKLKIKQQKTGQIENSKSTQIFNYSF